MCDSQSVWQSLSYSCVFLSPVLCCRDWTTADRDDIVEVVCVLCLVVKRANYLQSMLAVAVLMITM